MAAKKEIIIRLDTNLVETTDDLTGFNKEGQKTITTIDGLEKSVEELNTTLKNTEIGSAEYEQLRTQLRAANTELESLEGGFEAIQIQDRVDSVVKFGEAAVGAFGIATVGLRAFGASEESLEKVEAQLQSIITTIISLRAISEAFSSENLKRFKALRDGIKAQIAGNKALAKSHIATGVAAQTAGKMAKAALIGTGIGALIVLVGTLAANWDKVTDSIRKFIRQSDEAEVKERDRIEAVKDLTTEVSNLNVELSKLKALNVGEDIIAETKLNQQKKAFRTFLTDNLTAVGTYADELNKARDKFTDYEVVAGLSGLQSFFRKDLDLAREYEAGIKMTSEDIIAAFESFISGLDEATPTPQELEDFYKKFTPAFETVEQRKEFEAQTKQLIDGIKERNDKIEEITDTGADKRKANRLAAIDEEIADAKFAADRLLEEKIIAGATEEEIFRQQAENLLSLEEELNKQIANLERTGDDPAKLKALKQQLLIVEEDYAKKVIEINDQIQEDKDKNNQEDLDKTKEHYDSQIQLLINAQKREYDLAEAQGESQADLLQRQQDDVVELISAIQTNITALQSEEIIDQTTIDALKEEIKDLELLFQLLGISIKEANDEASEKSIIAYNGLYEFIAEKFTGGIVKALGIDEEQYGPKIAAFVNYMAQTISNIFAYMAEQSAARIEALNEDFALVEERYQESASNIEALENDLAKSKGARRKEILKDLEKERKTEKKLAAEKIALEKKISDEEYKAAKQKYALDLSNAIIQGGLAVLNALNFAPPASFIFAALAGALAAVNIGIIASNPPTRAADGMLIGPSHTQGGIPINTPGGMIEAEGGEIIINKKSSAMFRSQLSDINSYGGWGKKFQSGGTIDQVALGNIGDTADDATAGLYEAIAQITPVVSVVEITDQQNSVQTIEEPSIL